MKPYKKIITLADLRAHHVGHNPYPTDPDYLRIARDLHNIIRKDDEIELLGEDFARALAINLTLHLEDTVADTGLWRTFCTEYRRLYGRWLPFGWGDGEEDDKDNLPLDEVTVGSCQFIVWMTLCNKKVLRCVNPLMPAITTLAAKVFVYLDDVFCDVPINDDLLDDIYPDEDDFIENRKILEWLANDSYLSDWEVTRNTLDTYLKALEETFKDLSDTELIYGARAMTAFGSKVGPLALLPQEWYAAMLCNYAQKDLKQRADAIAAMEHAPFYIYIVESADEKFINVQSLEGQKYAIARDSFGPSINQEDFNSVNCFYGMMVRYNGVWQSNGMLSFFSSAKLDRQKELKRKEAENDKLLAELCNKYVNSRQGKRLFYFNSIKEIDEWMKNDIKLTDMASFFANIPQYINESKSLTVFIPEDGNFIVNCNQPEVIKDPDNPFYDEQKSREYGIALITASEMDSSEWFHYMLSRGMFAEAAFVGPNPKLNHALFQEHLDFIARFTRRANY